MIELSKINIGGGTQARAELNQSVVAEYAEIYKSGGQMPPVVVFFDGSEFWLADGFHRFFGAKQAGKTEIVEDRFLGTKRDAVLYSLSANANHGLRRTNADKRRAVETLLNDAEWASFSDRKIAEICAVGHPFVAAIRKPAAAEKQQENRDKSAAKKQKVESDSTPVQNPVEVSEPAYNPADDEAKELEDVVRTLADENEVLRVRLAMDANGATEEEKAYAFEDRTALLERIKSLEIENRAIIASRDNFMRENAELKRQCAMYRKQLDKMGKVAA